MEQLRKLDITKELDENSLKYGLADYNNPRWINYRLLSYENYAKCESYLRTFEFLLEINPLIAKEFAKIDKHLYEMQNKEKVVLDVKIFMMVEIN